MEGTAFSTCCFLLSGLYTVQLAPVREKISINTDLLNKVRQPSNYTEAKPHERVHNFAWRITVTVTTTPSTRAFTGSTLLSVDELSRHPEQNDIIHNQLIHTLKDPDFRKLWQNLIDQDYKKLIHEMRQPGAQKVFIKDSKDGTMDGPNGEKLYKKIVDFLEAVGIKGYKVILDTAHGVEMPDIPTEEPIPETEETTTEEPTTPRRTTISAKDIEKEPELFQKVYVQLSCTLKTKSLREKWDDIVKTQGYMSLMEELRKPGAREIFMRDNGDHAWDGPEGVRLYECTLNLLHTIGRKGYETLVETIDNVPLSPGEDLGLTPPDVQQ